MQLVGEEKRIQALFHELGREDEHLTPPFAAVWHAAQPRNRSVRSRLRLPVGAAAVVCLTLLSSTVLWRYERRAQPVRTADNATARHEPSTNLVEKKPGLAGPLVAEQRPGAGRRLRSLRLAARRRAELLAERQLATREAIAISSWQSPTAALLHFPGDEILRSLPPLNETADELKLF